MTYLSENTITQAWFNLTRIENVPNKFFGLLEVLRALELPALDKVQTQKQYTFLSARLSNALQERFTFDASKDFRSEEKYWLLLAKNWEDVIYTDFFGANPVNVVDIVVICYQNEQFNEEHSIESLINKFFHDYHLDASVFSMPRFLCREDYVIEWKDSVSEREVLKSALMNKLNLAKGSMTIGFEPPFVINSNAGELSRAPFFQTLYASQSSMKCLICMKFDFFSKYGFNEITEPSPSINFITNITPKQKIYFGSPGTGKSTALQNFVVEHGLEVVRTTFHPDTDYYSFVGGYKPVMKGDTIVYQFVPQAFIKAYVKAHQNPDRSYLLAIEEINRGNCAQIFGDLFQCLDRNAEGFSCYPIEANTDLVSYLTSEGLANPEQIILPPNLLIYATMNTSDQSLFPMDAAFKRRWDWEYVPIQFDEKAAAFKILFDTENQYAWRSFVETVNKRITEITKSEDKKIGVYFVVPTNGIISLEQFKNKVMFYLWSEIFKDEHSSEDSIFKYLDEDGNALDFTFNELFESDGLAKLKGFMNYLEIALI
jgi:hypothetical protein